MKTKKLIFIVEIILYVALFIFVGYGMYLGSQGQEVFFPLVQEDGLVENLTAIFLFAASMVSFYRVYQYRSAHKPLWVLTAVLIGILFFFAAGEEISWGQRIFNIQSGEFFTEHNKQGETNLHNLIVAGKDMNILIFSQLMFVVLILYFVFSPLLVRKIPFIKRLVKMFNVPLPRLQHVIVMLVVTAMIVSIHKVKESELHELSFAFIFFLIFMNPAIIDKE